MEVSMSVVIQALIGAAAGAFGAYVAIRSDLAELKAKVEHLHLTADKAHRTMLIPAACFNNSPVRNPELPKPAEA